MTRVLAIDPGPEQSAWVLYERLGPLHVGRVESFGLWDTERVRALCREARPHDVSVAVIEKVESYGMIVGREVFDTVHWAGRFTEALAHNGIPVVQLPRRSVKVAICGDTKAKDANVRAALIDRWGGKDRAIGTKAHPGPLYGVTADVWAALAIAVTYAEGGA